MLKFWGQFLLICQSLQNNYTLSLCNNFFKFFFLFSLLHFFTSKLKTSSFSLTSPTCLEIVKKNYFYTPGVEKSKKKKKWGVKIAWHLKNNCFNTWVLKLFFLVKKLLNNFLKTINLKKNPGWLQTSWQHRKNGKFFIFQLKIKWQHMLKEKAIFRLNNDRVGLTINKYWRSKGKVNRWPERMIKGNI